MLSTSIVMGAVGTAADWLVLITVVWLGMSQRIAVVPAFLTGATVGFFLNRRYTFAAHLDHAHGALLRQLCRFAVIDAVTLLLNVVLYNVLREWAGIDYRVSRLLASSIVHFGFTYPTWHWAFAKMRAGRLARRSRVSSRIHSGRDAVSLLRATVSRPQEDLPAE